MTEYLDAVASASWHRDLFAIVPLTLSAAMYLTGVARLWARLGTGAGIRRWEVASFAAGWATAAIALLSPIATMSEVLFSVHMTQHELLMLVAAPCIALGRPILPMAWALPRRVRLSPAASRPLRALSHVLCAPLTVFILHAVALWVWHIPALYEAAIESASVHLVQHLSFTLTACLFWWGILRGRYGRLGYGAALIYVFATAVHSGGLGALLMVAAAPLYPLYAARSAALGVDALTDQQLAGILMWIPAGIVFLVLGLAIFAAWLGEAERRRQVQTQTANCKVQSAKFKVQSD